MLGSILLSLLFLAGYYALCAAAFMAGGAKVMLRDIRHDKRSILAVLALLLLSTAGVCYLTFQDRFVYYWDYSAYWRLSIQQIDLIFSNPDAALARLGSSIAQSDYNYLLPTVVSLPYKISHAIMGGSYQQYVITCYVVFMLPAALGQALCAVKLLARLFPADPASSAGRRFAGAVLLAVLMPAGYYPILKGYIDAGILLPMTAAVFLLLDYDLTAPITARSLWRDLLFVLTLLLAWLSRRYAAFFIVGAVAAMLALAIIQLTTGKKAPAPAAVPAKSGKKKTRRKKAGPVGRPPVLNALCHFACMGAVGAAILLLFFRSFVLNALLTDYRTAYSAYDAALAEKLRSLGDSYGLAAMAAAMAAAVLYCLLKKRGRSQVFALLTLTAATALSFFTVQKMGVHHRCLVLIPLYLLTVAAVFPLFQKAANLPIRALSALCCAALAANFAYAFVPPSRAVLSPVRTSLCSAYAPMQRNDIDELRALRDYLLEKTEPEEKPVYVLASSGILNDDIIRCLDLPNSLLALPTLLLTNHVDLRDGFPTSFFSADVVVTTDPILTHLSAGTQEVVRYLAQQVQDSASPIGQHFIRDERTFTLDGGVTVYIYDLASPWTESDLALLRAYFADLYPDAPALFADRLTTE